MKKISDTKGKKKILTSIEMRRSIERAKLKENQDEIRAKRKMVVLKKKASDAPEP
jgi:hypothetical protein